MRVFSQHGVTSIDVVLLLYRSMLLLLYTFTSDMIGVKRFRTLVELLLSRPWGAQHECAKKHDSEGRRERVSTQTKHESCSYFCFFVDSSRLSSCNQNLPHVEVHPKDNQIIQINILLTHTHHNL